MQRLHLLAVFVAIALPSVTAFGQSQPVNLDFESGDLGTVPEGWSSPGPAYTAKQVDENPREGRRCLLFERKENTASAYGFIRQVVDAKPYWGKRVRLRAAVRFEPTRPMTEARLCLETGTGGGFLANSVPILSPKWEYYEAFGNVPSGAKEIGFGLMVVWGRAWLDDVSLEVLDRAQFPPHALLPPWKMIWEEVVVRASIEKVWYTWATAAGCRSFFAPDAEIELRVGGKYELYFDPQAPEGARGSEGCTVLAYVPWRMLAFSWSAPPRFPNVRKERTQVVLLFEMLAHGDRTRVTLIQHGWGEGDEWDQAVEYFLQAWPRVLRNLKNRLEGRSVDTDSTPWSRAAEPGPQQRATIVGLTGWGPA